MTFIAAEKNELAETSHIIKAARTEFKKIGKMIIIEDMEEFL